MKQETLYGIIGLLLGVVITVFVASTFVNSNNTSAMRMMGMHTQSQNNSMTQDKDTDKNHGMDSQMHDMTGGLRNKTGDVFDKAFLSEMIIHHQGAIDMAKDAQKNAKHDEIKNLANDIIKAQTSEIEQMKKWQEEWGY